MQIDPQYPLPLVYQLSDPNDTGTYYVRSVVRNSLSGATLNSINLTNGGSGRFTGTFTSPQDQTGQGFHIDVTTTVYTDSGYTTPSDVYQKENMKYLVKRVGTVFGGGGGVDIDYEKIARIVQAIIDKKKFDGKAVDFKPVLEKIASVHKAVKAIEIPEIPEAEKVELAPVMQAIETVKTELLGAVAGIDIPEPKEVDFAPVMAAFEALATQVESIRSLSGEQKTELVTTLKTIVEEMKSSNEARTKKTWEAAGKLIGDIGAQKDLETPEETGVVSPFQKLLKQRP